MLATLKSYKYSLIASCSFKLSKYLIGLQPQSRKVQNQFCLRYEYSWYESDRYVLALILATEKYINPGKKVENKEKNVVKYRKGGKIQHEHTCGTRSPVLCLNLSRGQEATQITLTIPYNATLHLHISKLFCFVSNHFALLGIFYFIERRHIL